MRLLDILYSQGFGTRRICSGLIEQGWVEVLAGDAQRAQICADPWAVFETAGLRFRVQGVDWEYHAKAYLMLHKPAGVECSQRPSAYPSVYGLLPAALRQRPGKGGLRGVQAVGRLDQDTTGLLLLSDDGAFIHRLTSPKKNLPKVYQVTTKHPVTRQQCERLCAGVVLDDDPRPLRAAGCVMTAENRVDLTLTEGKYHQVKRMLAAVGNRVQALHRSRIAGLLLPQDLAPGRWRWLDAADLTLLR